jgi:hypothetical protein
MLSQQRSWQLSTILVLMLALSVGVSGRVVGQARTEVGTAPQSNPGNATPTSPPLPTSPAAVPPALSADRDATAARPRAAVSEGDGNLPNTQGQIWREYDITPYTAQVTTTERPEQAILDWILRDTGTEVWFNEPLGILSANRQKLTVYHTPEMQELVHQIVDRFVISQAEQHAFALRLVTVGSPNWRSRSLALLRSVPVQSPGVDAWLLSKENAAVLLGELRKRSDCREQNAPNLLIHNGQSQTIGRMNPRNYVRSVSLTAGFPGYQLESAQIQEGYSLQISPLLSLDKTTLDAVIKCNVDQVERLVDVPVDLAGVGGQRESVEIQVPQVVSWRLHERFRWPAQQVLVLSCGVVATPAAERTTVLGLPNLLLSSPGRADALLFIEMTGTASQSLLETRSADRTTPNTGGRY